MVYHPSLISRKYPRSYGSTEPAKKHQPKQHVESTLQTSDCSMGRDKKVNREKRKQRQNDGRMPSNRTGSRAADQIGGDPQNDGEMGKQKKGSAKSFPGRS